MDLLQYIGSIGGITGVLAFVLLMAYRRSNQQMRDDRKYMEDRLTKVLDAYNATTFENTKVLAELYTWLKAKNGSK